MIHKTDKDIVLSSWAIWSLIQNVIQQFVVLTARLTGFTAFINNSVMKRNWLKAAVITLSVNGLQNITRVCVCISSGCLTDPDHHEQNPFDQNLPLNLSPEAWNPNEELLNICHALWNLLPLYLNLKRNILLLEIKCVKATLLTYTSLVTDVIVLVEWIIEN